jgi:hypothetical protein
VFCAGALEVIIILFPAQSLEKIPGVLHSQIWGLSSAAERSVHIRKATGSSPVVPTILSSGLSSFSLSLSFFNTARTLVYRLFIRSFCGICELTIKGKLAFVVEEK